jgi:phosphoribosyl-ATP pyrophosphohydrolase/phosphoribosyl-AMP cyclohydrolase
MIIPSIDLMDGQAVQLIGGEKKAIEAGDPMPIAERFSVAGEIAVIDLDAALGRGDNKKLVQELVKRHACRVGGGIRDRDTAVKWLDAGAKKIILGTAATPDMLSSLPRERVIAALDARSGEVVVEGWRKNTGASVLARIKELEEYVVGFLVTMVEREGRMLGMDMKQVGQVAEAAGNVKVTVAGGVAVPEEVAAIDRLGADVQVGMALYSGRMDLADAIVAPMKSDRPDRLWATVIVDEIGRALGFAFSDLKSVREAVRTKRGVYHSRSRGLWMKGLTSGDTQDLRRIDLDCDRDVLRFVVKQNGNGFCHNGTWTCWGEDWGLGRLLKRIKERAISSPEGSYTKRLLDDPVLLKSKLIEEAEELADARPAEVAHEAADLFYFALAAMSKADVDLEAVERELERRSLCVTRRE